MQGSSRLCAPMIGSDHERRSEEVRCGWRRDNFVDGCCGRVNSTLHCDDAADSMVHEVDFDQCGIVFWE
jgi:hypothetical protein